MTRYLVVTDDATPADICEAITNLRAKQRAACIESTRREIGADVDELLDLLIERDRTSG
jgi:hypothetical protein